MQTLFYTSCTKQSNPTREIVFESKSDFDSSSTYATLSKTLGPTQSQILVAWVKGIKSNSQLVINKKNRENTRQRKTITCTRQYLRGSAICLRPQSCRDITIIKEEYRVLQSATIFSLSIKHNDHTTLKKP